MKMETLKKMFETSIKQTYVTHVFIVVEMDGFPEDEIILNKIENAKSKLAYYEKIYDENGYHRFSKGIRIKTAGRIIDNDFGWFGLEQV